MSLGGAVARLLAHILSVVYINLILLHLASGPEKEKKEKEKGNKRVTSVAKLWVLTLFPLAVINICLWTGIWVCRDIHVRNASGLSHRTVSYPFAKE